MKNRITIEICAGSLTDALTASSIAEVDRIELNSALELGGLTPTIETLKEIKEHSDKTIVCMVRPRPAGFCYSDVETEQMYREAESLLKAGADGIVFGFLNEKNRIDRDKTERMVNLIHSCQKEAVFHRAFDLTSHPYKAMEDLIAFKVDRVLTSGQKDTACEGKDLIKDLQMQYGNQIQILPGAGVKKDNAADLLSYTGCTMLHMTAKTVLHDNGEYYAVSRENILGVLETL